MMRAIILFAQIAVLVFAAVWLAGEPGTVTIVWRNWRIDPPIGLVVLAVVLVAMAAAVAYRVWRFLVRAPGRLVASRRINKERKGYRALADGMVALAGGDPSSALRQAKRAATLLEQPAASHLLLAQAAELEGNSASAQDHFEAMLRNPATEFVGLQGLMRLRLEVGDTENALQYAQRAILIRPGATWLLPQLFKLLVAANAWADADSTIAEALRRRAVPMEQGKRWRAAVLAHRGQLAQAEGDSAAAIGFMREASDLDPALVPASVVFSRLLAEEGKRRRATRVLEQAWSRKPHRDIAEAYVRLVGGDDTLEQVKAGQRLLSFNPNAPYGSLFMAEISLKARLWGEARKYLERVLQSHPTASAYQLMAALEESEGNDPEAANTWLSKIASALPDETWICRECGSTAEEWAPVCGNCTAIASLEWRVSPRGRSANLLASPSTLALTATRIAVQDRP